MLKNAARRVHNEDVVPPHELSQEQGLVLLPQRLHTPHAVLKAAPIAVNGVCVNLTHGHNRPRHADARAALDELTISMLYEVVRLSHVLQVRPVCLQAIAEHSTADLNKPGHQWKHLIKRSRAIPPPVLYSMALIKRHEYNQVL